MRLKAILGTVLCVGAASCALDNGEVPTMTGPSTSSVSSAFVAPTAAFAFLPAAPQMREPVTFDATTTSRLGVRCEDACTYAWDFGGEGTATGRVAAHRFQTAATYPVRLTVTDQNGAVATSTQNVAVVRGDLPTPTFTFSPTSPGQFEPVNFSAARSVAAVGRTIVSYQWNFGDGSTGSGVTASHAYQSIGAGTSTRSQTYRVTLTVTDSVGLESSSNQDVTVVSGLTATFTSSNPVDLSLQVAFNAEESRGSSNGFGGRNAISKYIWHFGIPSEGSTLVETSSPITTKTFPAAATYTITLTVEDSAGRREAFSASVAVVN